MRILTVMAILAAMACPVVSAYDDPMKGPWDRNLAENMCQDQSEKTLNPGRALVRFYREYISPIDGSHCGMHPSCSEYSIQAFQKHGFFMGWVMTIDRLFRCGRDELRLSPWIRVDGELKCYDPLENNDFWWSSDE